MRRSFIVQIFLSMLFLGMVGYWASAGAQEGGVVVYAKLIEGPFPTDDPWSAQWDQAQAVEFPLSGQVHWEPRNLMPSVTAIKVRALHNGNDLAILLEYKDASQDSADGAGIEFPVGEEKAHFAHGQPMLQVGGGPVNIWFWRGDQAQDMNAKGFGTLKVQDQQDVKAKGVWRNEVWRVVFTRKLQTGDSKDVQINPGKFSQIAFAVWDGAKGEQGSRKAVSSWWYFRAEPPPDHSIWVYTLIAVAGTAMFEFVLVRRLRKKVKAS